LEVVVLDSEVLVLQNGLVFTTIAPALTMHSNI